jgi:redox-sensitive bicupin YhaK (pirin superfamily)
MTTRQLIKVLDSEAVTDGDGVKIQRSVARGALQTFDPFLLLDEIVSDEAADYIGGFPEHPHRGFETVTYMLEGTMAHRDHLGNEGLLVSGGVQWMTAGRGVLHSEMPQQDEGRLHGFQLWVNLPAAEKMNEPAYREYGPDEIPAVSIGNGSRVKVIAGSVEVDGKSVVGPVGDVTTQPDYFDVELAAGASLELPTDPDKRVLLYVYRGAIEMGGRPLKQQQLGMLNEGESLSLAASEDSAFLVLAGVPIAEPVANWGPFVMNTREEIDQAIQDYQQGRLV